MEYTILNQELTKLSPRNYTTSTASEQPDLIKTSLSNKNGALNAQQMKLSSGFSRHILTIDSSKTPL